MATYEVEVHATVVLHFNKGLAQASPNVVADARTTAVHPDVPDAFALAIVAWPEQAPRDIRTW